MPSGIQIWDANGVLTFGDDSVAVKFLGTLALPNSDGSISVPEFTAYAGHTPFFARVDGQYPAPEYDAQVSISGSTLSWTWPHSTKTAVSIIYGIS
jgi:hypothetical protein